MARRVICCGSRGWHDRQKIQDALADAAERLGTCDIVVVHGDAKGADRIAKQEAEKHGFRVEAHPYRRFISGTVSAKRAPLERNKHMASLGADLCLAFWDGQSTGTKDMMDKAEVAGIPVKVIKKT